MDERFLKMYFVRLSNRLSMPPCSQWGWMRWKSKTVSRRSAYHLPREQIFLHPQGLGSPSHGKSSGSGTTVW